MQKRNWLLLATTLRVALYASGCTTTTAPARFTHPLLTSEGAPHSAPFAARLPHAAFDGDPGDRSDDAETQAVRAQIASNARAYIGSRRFVVGGQRLPFDCSGLARAVYLKDGIDIMASPRRHDENAVRLIYDYARRHGIVYRHGKPAIGDLVFFDDTYDRNGNGRHDDPLTHIAVVEKVDPDGTVTVVHTVAKGVLRYRMNLRYPERTRDPKTGQRVNHYLRRKEGSRAAQTTAALFAGYATVITSARGIKPHLASR